MDNNKTSITDLPKTASAKDNFGIEPFQNGLIKFIENTNTPITIALQGEWGSGKTSLMNSLQNRLCDNEGKRFHSIWLNTWEHSLMKDAETTLIEIISELIVEISSKAKIDDSKVKEVLNTFWSGIKSTSKVVAKNALNKTLDGAGELVGAFDSKGKSTIGTVRNELEQIIETCIKKDNKDGFIFFIDDLDRIDPPVAVNLLELLKNIFTLKNCVFVLAIDYDVVIKGLEPKFGNLTEKNEREFRSFFDKIIQVPFSMPVGSYSIDGFLKESLNTIQYLNKEQLGNKELIKSFTEIANLSVGTNPRALKRLMNSLSLIICINKAKNSKEEDDELNDNIELLINFALVSIQIAYPSVYRLLVFKGDFEKWDTKAALQFNLKELESQSVEKLKLIEEFDEDWEQIVFRLCENDHYLKKKALSISRLLNLMRSIIHKDKKNIEDVIESVISLSSVTSIEAIELPKKQSDSSLLKIIRDSILPELKLEIPERSNYFKPLLQRISNKLPIQFHKGEYPRVLLEPEVSSSQVKLSISITGIWVNNDNDYSIEDFLEKKGTLDNFKLLETEFNNYTNEKIGLTQCKLNESVTNFQGGHQIELCVYIEQKTIEDIITTESINSMVQIIKDLINFIDKLGEVTGFEYE